MGFDSVARYYDQLAGLVFGKSLKEAQRYFLNRIQPSANVLVVGGGTGWWLKDFLYQNPTCKICFIDTSAEMLKLARKSVGEDHRVSFYLGTENSVTQEQEFDVVVSFCFFDLFSDVELNQVVRKINESTKPNTLWLATDFVDIKWWHSFMLIVMYRFFNLTTGLKTRRLPNWELALMKNGILAENQKLFYKGFIKSATFKSND